MKRRPVLERLDGWRTGLLRDPAGVIDAFAEPWRTLGLLQLAAATQIAGTGRRARHWRSLMAERPMLVVARDEHGGFLAACELEAGHPGVLRLRRPAARIVAYAYGGMEAGPVRLASFTRRSAFAQAHAAGVDLASALQAAWPPSGPRLQLRREAFAPPDRAAYAAWIARNETAAAPPTSGPTFVIAGAAELTDQGGPHWRLVESGAAQPGEVEIVLAPDDTLGQGALAALAAAFEDPATAAVYADEDHIDAQGRSAPVFKTAFDPERLETQDYIGGAIARRIGAAGAVRHLPRVLWRRRNAQAWPSKPASPNLPDPAPKVLMVVPTRDRPSLLRACAEGVLNRTAYPSMQLCIVDNGSVEAETLGLLETLRSDPRVRVLRIDGPFDFPRLNNAAVTDSDAEVVCFLNDDTWVITPDWLSVMTALAVRPATGAVGAKLFYPDGRLQHAGVTLGLGPLGVAGHGFRGAPGDLDGPQRMLKVRRHVSAVTGACLVVERNKFEAVGGFDAAFQVAFNDVDLCLRLADRGWASVWTPDAQMVHLEGATRGKDVSPERLTRLEGEAALMRARWGARLAADPYYHPALYLAGERFALGDRTRSEAPR